MKSFIIIGLGRFGSNIALQLASQGCEVLAIDHNKDRVQSIADFVTKAVVADIRDKEVLKTLGVHNFDCAVVAIGMDIAASVLATMNLKSLNVPFIVCKAQDNTHREVLDKLGADRVVMPEQEFAIRIAKSLVSPNVFEYIELSDECGIIEINTPKSWIGSSLLKLNVRDKYGVSIIAIKKGRKITVAPGGQYVMEPNDTLVIIGESGKLERIEKM